MDFRRRLAALAVLVVCLPSLAADVRQPVSESLFKAFKTFYDYDAKQPLNPEIVKSETVDGGTKSELLRFSSTNGERVPARLLIPPGTKKHPVVLCLHGYGMNKEMIAPIGPLLGNFGLDWAFLALDAQYHGERAKPGQELFSPDLEKTRKAIVQTVVDYRRALDYIATRPELDSERVAAVGLSLGGILDVLLTAVEPRLKTSVMVVAGADWVTLLQQSQMERLLAFRNQTPPPDWKRLTRLIDPVDPLNYAPHLGERPVLLLNATEDEIIPKACAQRLHDTAVAKPLVKEWLEGGHMLPQETALQRVMEWLTKYL